MRIPLSWLRDFVDVPWGAKELGARLTMSGFELEALDTAAPQFSGVVVAEIVEAVETSAGREAAGVQGARIAQRWRAAADRLWRGECARRASRRRWPLSAPNYRATRPSPPRSCAAWIPLGMLCFREGAWARRHFRRHRRAAGRCARGHGSARLPAARRRNSRAERHPESRRRHVGARHRARSCGALARRPIRCQRRHRSRWPLDRRRLSGEAGGARRLPEAGEPRRPRHQQPAALRRCGCASACAARACARSARWWTSPTTCCSSSASPCMPTTWASSRAAWMRGLRSARRNHHAARWQGNRAHDRCAGDRRCSKGPWAWPASWAARAPPARRDTVDVLFEAAFFAPAAIAGRGRRYGLVTDAGQRFERGVDPAHQERAVERATQLLLEIAGGTAGPVHVDAGRRPIAAPRRSCVAPRAHRAPARHADRRQRREGDAGVARHAVRADEAGWLVTPPSHRFDIAIEAGPHRRAGAHRRVRSHQPKSTPSRAQKVRPLAEQAPVELQALEILATRGYQEAITYAFVDPALQDKLFPGVRHCHALAIPSPATWRSCARRCGRA